MEEINTNSSSSTPDTMTDERLIVAAAAEWQAKDNAIYNETVQICRTCAHSLNEAARVWIVNADDLTEMKERHDYLTIVRRAIEFERHEAFEYYFAHRPRRNKLTCFLKDEGVEITPFRDIQLSDYVRNLTNVLTRLTAEIERISPF